MARRQKRSSNPLQQNNGKTVSSAKRAKRWSLAGLSVTHGLYQQFRCVDKHYAALLEHVHYWQPTQKFLDSYQEGRVCVQSQIVRDRDIWQGIVQDTSATVLTVPRKAADRVNSVVVDKCSWTKSQCRRLLAREDQRMVFSYPSTSLNEDGNKIVTYPFTPAYGLTICKAQGATLNKVLLWLDCPIVPAGTAYVGMSRVRRLEDITFLNRVLSSQVKPVCQHAE
ncbi:hypothetical protein OS493_019910 [Desmophyllum pertusum]|uniref:Uncharacterized protein n=1 Tax=Desmophyllum pertusum TaxID=174260 RepID=A0A9W9YMY5_9CNID|nr:hypothetical protein OS493_019910 [Desmophyllum pertusum]